MDLGRKPQQAWKWKFLTSVKSLFFRFPAPAVKASLFWHKIAATTTTASRVTALEFMLIACYRTDHLTDTASSAMSESNVKLQALKLRLLYTIFALDFISSVFRNGAFKQCVSNGFNCVYKHCYDFLWPKRRFPLPQLVGCMPANAIKTAI